MHLVACDQLAQMRAQLVVRIGRDVVELVNGDQTIVEGFYAELVDRKAEGRMGADQHPVVAFQKAAQRVDLAAIGARRVAQVPARLHLPVRPEAILAERFVIEAGADGLFGHHDDCLAQILIGQLVERDEHQCAALAGGRRRLDQQILLAALFKGAFLHRAHAQLVRLCGGAALRIADGNGRDGLGHVSGSPFDLSAIARARSRAPWNTASTVTASAETS